MTRAQYLAIAGRIERGEATANDAMTLRRRAYAMGDPADHESRELLRGIRREALKLATDPTIKTIKVAWVKLWREQYSEMKEKTFRNAAYGIGRAFDEKDLTG